MTTATPVQNLTDRQLKLHERELKHAIRCEWGGELTLKARLAEIQAELSRRKPTNRYGPDIKPQPYDY
jgi:hypothetical protein